jgi:tetratricopeptide (TPR) repeat protein
MEKRLYFRFEIPAQPEGPLIQMSAEEMERFLLKRLEDEKAEPTDALWELARFYGDRKQHEKAIECLRKVLVRYSDLERKARCVLAMGGTIKQVEDFEAAVRYYKEALALEPLQNQTWYFINNNLGFSLNKLSRFAEGETYCRKAIEIDANRPNAYKNLGIALAGQAQYVEAAKCFVSATQVNAADARAFHLLQDLVKQHPELAFEFGEIVECCGKAVEVAGQEGRGIETSYCSGMEEEFDTAAPKAALDVFANAESSVLMR